MSSYPTPEEWRAHAMHARQMAEAYRREGNARKADDRDATADFYNDQAIREEWRLAQITKQPEARQCRLTT